MVPFSQKTQQSLLRFWHFWTLILSTCNSSSIHPVAPLLLHGILASSLKKLIKNLHQKQHQQNQQHLDLLAGFAFQREKKRCVLKKKKWPWKMYQKSYISESQKKNAQMEKKHRLNGGALIKHMMDAMDVFVSTSEHTIHLCLVKMPWKNVGELGELGRLWWNWWLNNFQKLLNQIRPSKSARPTPHQCYRNWHFLLFQPQARDRLDALRVTSFLFLAEVLIGKQLANQWFLGTRGPYPFMIIFHVSFGQKC